jgi:hypothetical protein
MSNLFLLTSRGKGKMSLFEDFIETLKSVLKEAPHNIIILTGVIFISLSFFKISQIEILPNTEPSSLRFVGGLFIIMGFIRDIVALKPGSIWNRLIFLTALGVFFFFITIPPYKIEIVSPTDGSKITYPVSINGTFSGKLPEGKHAWLIISSDNPYQWWPKMRFNQIQGRWDINVWVGDEKDDGKQNHYIDIVLMDETDNDIYLNHLKKYNYTEPPSIEPPKSAYGIKRITVTRINNTTNITR